MEKIYDIAIVGGGPAGLTAALYGLRNGKSVLIIERQVFGGQIANSPKVENIPGFVEISGDEYGDLLLQQVIKQGGEVLFDEVLSVEEDKEYLTLKLDIEEDVYAKTLILATGTVHRHLNLENEEQLIGKKIHFCAVCDGNFYKDKKVVLIGGGNSAFVEANLLADSVSKLSILQDMPYFTADKKLQDALLNNPKIDFHLNTKVLEYVLEENEFKGIRYLENEEEKFIECDGVFLAIGLIPDNDKFKNLIKIDERGYFVSDEYGLTDNSRIFVAGDCRNKKLRQVATAISDGANAAISACHYLNY
ncbi:MAG: FAD-dependent oxidoreductase [Erysipelotrichaceae bacterium]|nr:FAD-dependent oxidoreductase [Erysipelotrichaceae bacterium]